MQSVRGCRRDRGSSAGCLRASPCLCPAWKRRSSAAGLSASGTESRLWWSNSQLLASMRTVSDGHKEKDVICAIVLRCVFLALFPVNFVLYCWETPVSRIASVFRCPVTQVRVSEVCCVCITSFKDVKLIHKYFFWCMLPPVMCLNSKQTFM